MSDVYRIQMSMNLAGDLAPEMRALLRSMTAVETRAKGVEKAIAGWSRPAGAFAREIKAGTTAMSGAARSADRVTAGMLRIAPAARQAANETRAIGRAIGTAEARAFGVGSAIRSWTGPIRSAVGHVNALTNALNRAQNGGNRPLRLPGPRAAGGGQLPAAAAGFGVYSGGYAAERATRAVAGEAGGRVREDIRAKNAGITPEENLALRLRASELATKYPSLSPLDVREQGRLLIPNVGSYEKANALLPTFIEGRVALKSILGPKGDDKEMETFARYVDIIGKSMSVEDTTKLIDGYLRARQLDSSAIQARDFEQMAKGAAAPGKGFSTDFWAKVAPVLMMQQGGSRTGVDFASAYQNFMIGRGTAESIIAQEQWGLRSGVQWGRKRSGKIEISDKGKLVDENLFGSNPDEWAKKHLLPKLIGKGMMPQGWGRGDFSQDLNDQQRTAIVKATSDLFSNRRGANIFSMLMADFDQNQTVMKRLGGAKGAADVTKDQQHDPFVAGSALITQLKGLGAVLAEPAMQQAGPMLHGVASGLGALSAALSSNPELMKLAGAGATVAGAAGLAGLSKITGGVAARLLGGLGAGSGTLGTMTAIGRMFRGGLIGSGVVLGGRILLGDKGTAEANNYIDMGQRAARGQATKEELAQIEQGSANLRKALRDLMSSPAAPTVAGAPTSAPAFPQRDFTAPGQGDASMGKGAAWRPDTSGAGAFLAEGAKGAADDLRKTEEALKATGGAAEAATPGLNTTKSALDGVAPAAGAASGGIMGLINTLRTAIGIGGASAAGGPSPAGGAPAPSAAAPGKQSRFVAPPQSTMAQVNTNLYLDGRKVARSVTRHQVAGMNRPTEGAEYPDHSRALPQIG